jgi:hypothetical protein
MDSEPIDWQRLINIIHIPPQILQFRPLGNRFGLQMHFLLQPR